MDVVSIPLSKPNQKISASETFELKEDNNTYQLNIKIIEQNIIFNIKNINYILEEYEKELNLEELKQIHNIFLGLNSCQEFLEYIKGLIKNNKLSINIIDENKISIIIFVEYLLKQSQIDIALKKKILALI